MEQGLFEVGIRLTGDGGWLCVIRTKVRGHRSEAHPRTRDTSVIQSHTEQQSSTQSSWYLQIIHAVVLHGLYIRLLLSAWIVSEWNALLHISSPAWWSWPALGFPSRLGWSHIWIWARPESAYHCYTQCLLPASRNSSPGCTSNNCCNGVCKCVAPPCNIWYVLSTA